MVFGLRAVPGDGFLASGGTGRWFFSFGRSRAMDFWLLAVVGDVFEYSARTRRWFLGFEQQKAIVLRVVDYFISSSEDVYQLQ